MTILDRHMLIEMMSAGELPVTTRNLPFNNGGGGGGDYL